MKSLIFNIDFDGTCVTHDYPDIGKSIGAESVLSELVEAGHRLILFTMRHGPKLDEAVAWFKERGIPLWGVQTNPEQWSWTESPKSYAQVMIDDSALGTPMKPPNPLVSHRPYVDWVKVRTLLVQLGALPSDGSEAVCDKDQLDHALELYRLPATQAAGQTFEQCLEFVRAVDREAERRRSLGQQGGAE